MSFKSMIGNSMLIFTEICCCRNVIQLGRTAMRGGVDEEMIKFYENDNDAIENRPIGKFTEHCNEII